jgi:hypothetical protein
MSKDGFDAADISSTFARFDNKRRSIVCDESKLERKKPEPIALTSATGSLGQAVLSGMVSGISGPSKKTNDNDFLKDRPWLWQSWEHKEDFQ